MAPNGVTYDDIDAEIDYSEIEKKYVFVAS